MVARTTIEPTQAEAVHATGYPPQLLRRVAEHTGFSYRLSALDLSQDGGELAVELSRQARTVTVALEDEHALAVAAQKVKRHQARVQLRKSAVADLIAEGARYWLVTIGCPLHVRDGATLLEQLDGLVERGGAIAVLGYRYPRLPENDWRFALGATPYEAAHDLDEGLLLHSAFGRVERISVFERRTLSVDKALAKLRPVPSEAVRRELRARAGADGTLEELIEGHALIARREGDRGGRWS